MGVKETSGVLEMTVYICKCSNCTLKINPLCALSKKKTDLFEKEFCLIHLCIISRTKHGALHIRH